MIIHTLVRLLRRIRRRKGAGFGVISALLILSIVGNSLCFRLFETNEDGNAYTIWESLWYSVISITTIGYGDYSASTLGGRLGTVLFIVILGMGSFTVILGLAIEGIASFTEKEIRGMSDSYASNHIVIVNFPSQSRVSQLIEELQADPHHAGSDIVIVSNELDSLPFTKSRVTYVRGPVLKEETYLRANIGEAKMAIVLAGSYSDPNADAVVASSAAVINRLHREVHLVAECLNPEHRMLFSTVNCDAIIFSMEITNNLLAQEAQDPGISQMIDEITSSKKGMTLYSTRVESDDKQATYKDLAVRMLDRDMTLISVNRAKESHTVFSKLSPARGDRVIYTGARRLTWQELKG